MPRHADTDLVQRIVASEYPNKLAVLTPCQWPMRSGWSLAIAVLGEAGYRPLSAEIYTDNDYGYCHDECDRINAVLHPSLDQATIIAVVADTMSRSRRKEEKPVDVEFLDEDGLLDHNDTVDTLGELVRMAEGRLVRLIDPEITWMPTAACEASRPSRT